MPKMKDMAMVPPISDPGHISYGLHCPNCGTGGASSGDHGFHWNYRGDSSWRWFECLNCGHSESRRPVHWWSSHGGVPQAHVKRDAIVGLSAITGIDIVDLIRGGHGNKTS